MRLVVEKLVCRRGERLVLPGVSVAVAAGSALYIVGPNGAGKTTLLRAVAGLIRPDGGTVSLAGGNPDYSVGEQSHFLCHRDPLKSVLSVRENLASAAALCGAASPDGLEAALVAAGLDGLADLPAGVLSAGQKRRLSLARLLAASRPLWLLDEPSASLDAAGQGLLGRMIAQHCVNGGIVLAATHDPPAEAVGNRLVLGPEAAGAIAA